jgi:hypothetical protein
MRKVIFVILIVTANVFAQTRFNNNSPFVSGLVGAAKISTSSNNGESPVSLAFGGSFGIPIIKNLFLYTRTSYTSYSNFQSYFNTSYLNSNFQISNEIAEVNSSFSQLLINGGLLYNIILSKEFVLGINGGASFMVVNQEAKLRTGTVISSIDNESIWGAFGGLIIEKSWEDSDVTTFFEAQYNYAKSDAFYRTNTLSSMNYTFGARYYLEGR